jgi:hypothetical protein
VTGAKLDAASVRQWSRRRNVLRSDNALRAPAHH